MPQAPRTPAPFNQELYKYRVWNKYTRQIFKNGQLYFACPDDFNDPFDSKLTPTLVGSDDDWYSWFLRTLPKKRMKGAPSSLVEQKARQLIQAKQHRDPVLHANLRSKMERQQANAGIVSLSMHRDNLLMWAHYACRHKGLCIGLTIPPNPYLVPFCVVYSEKRPELNIHDPSYEERVLDYCLLTKAACWRCEDEYRLVLPDFHGPRDIPREWLTSVILGLFMSDRHQAEVLGLVKRTNPDALCLRAKKSETQFGLEFEEVTS